MGLYIRSTGMRISLISLLFYFFFASICFGQTDSVSLVNLLHNIQRRAPSIVADSLDVVLASDRLNELKLGRLPDVKVNYQVNLGTNNNLPGGFFGNGLVPTNSRVRDESSTRTILTDLGVAAFNWEVYDFGGYRASVRVAESEIDLRERAFYQSKYNLLQLGLEGYLQLTLIAEMQRIQLQNIIQNQEIRRTIRALAISGIKAGVDTSIAEAELSRARLTMLELGKQKRLLQSRLSFVSGIAPEYIVGDTLLEDMMIQKYSLFAGVQDKSAEHPTLQYYRALEQNSLQKELLIRKNTMPYINVQAAAWGRGASLSVENEYRPFNHGLGFERFNYLAGIGITYSLTDLRRTAISLRTQQTSTLQARQRTRESAIQLESEIAEAAIELTTAYDRLLEIPNQLEAARAAYRQKLSLYRNGLTNIVELNTALSVLYRAETDYAQARFSYCRFVFRKALLENQLDSVLNIITER